MPIIKKTYCISCLDRIQRYPEDSPDLEDAKSVRCEECAREVLGLPTRQTKNIQSLGYFYHGTGGGTRVLRESKTH